MLTSSPTKRSPPVRIQKNIYAKAGENVFPALEEVHHA